MPSFDITSEINKVELRNALEQSNKEISTRFDFKGSDARVEEKDLVITLYADDEFKLKQVTDVLNSKCAKRGLDLRAFEVQEPQSISGGKLKQEVKVRNGIDSDNAKRIVRLIKDAKMKVQASIQGEAVRVSGAKKDDLQSAIALVRGAITEFPVQFTNFRD
jgi:uncharacterized protein YajQ (UPF0234 family)